MEMIFTLFKRKGKRGNYIYYVRFWNSETNKIIKTLSSGKFTLKDASRWALEQIQEYNFLKAKSIPTFQSYTENWFVWDECTFIEKQLAKGKRFSRSHADRRRGILKNHFHPYFGNKKLTDIRVIDIENFMTKIKKNDYSPSTINSSLHTLNSILKEAYRQEIIQTNPMDRVEPVVKRTKRPIFE